jgi:hypothetical protein
MKHRFSPAIWLAFGLEKAEHIVMTTVTKPSGLCGWSVRCAMAAISLAVCASAFAEPSKSAVTSKQTAVKSKRCVALITGSACRQPCDRLGVIPTTPYQLDRVGAHTATNE